MIKLLDFSGKLFYIHGTIKKDRYNLPSPALAEQSRIGGDLHTIELFPATQEDVLDESVDAYHEKKVDFDNDEKLTWRTFLPQ